ncbi:MAG: hypothetical protein WDW38_011170 [Sanguina aurantia]
MVNLRILHVHVQGAALDRDTALDAEAEALLAELARSQVEVHSLLQQQQDQVSELGGMKEHLSCELSELQEEAWKLSVFTELEALKKQLASLGHLEADIDRAEEYLDDLESGHTALGLDEGELDVDTSEAGIAAAVAAASARRRAAQAAAIQGLLDGPGGGGRRHRPRRGGGGGVRGARIRR